MNRETLRGGRSLFRRTLLILALTLFGLAAIILASSAFFAMLPMAKRSADDLAALVVLSAQTWAELPPYTRPDFIRELEAAHDITLLENDAPLEPLQYPPVYFYLRLLHDNLERRLPGDADVVIGRDPRHPQQILIRVPTTEAVLRFGISEERIGARPPVILLVMLLSVLLAALVSAWLIARRITRPLEVLTEATTAVGQGRRQVLGEMPDAADEINILIANFNDMAQQVADLLENRTTLLAGISHDLRTPLTRLRLMLEIHASAFDEDTRRGLEKSLDDMELLLQQTLQLARGIEHREEPERLDLVELLERLARDMQSDWRKQHPRSSQEIRFERGTGVEERLHWDLPRQSCMRVLHNLLSNALRHAPGEPIVIRLEYENGCPVILIRDRGPGIPLDQRDAVFRPFHRVEGSRSSQTGGSGLGLAVVRQLCAALGWQISLHGRDGGGTESRLRLCGDRVSR